MEALPIASPHAAFPFAKGKCQVLHGSAAAAEPEAPPVSHPVSGTVAFATFHHRGQVCLWVEEGSLGCRDNTVQRAPHSGRPLSRALPTERTLARVCCEAGATV